MSGLSFKTFFTTLSGILLLAYFSPVFATCTKIQVAAADARWAKAIDSNEVKQTVNLYASQAVLLATIKNKPIVTQQGRVIYFTQFFRNYPQVKVHYTGEKYIQIFGDGAVSSGLYTFSWQKDHKQFEVPARYTFVYRATPNGCELITHHSSKLPE